MNKMIPRTVLDFWFSAGSDKWFKKDEAFDAQIVSLFSEAVVAAVEGAFDDWCKTPEGALALVILLDQFPRNIHRGHADAFAYDARAREVARGAIDLKYDTHIPATARQWFYMPFMHSEALDDQEVCIQLLESRLAEDEGTLRFAILHRDLIARFGRFPHRNKVLGRPSTPDERTYLSSQNAFSG